jgi:S-DNA-T family DNA segregation ATPase FtsK/SpoIIIE
MPAMLGLLQIMEKRMDHIKAAGFKNINDFNARHYGKNRLPSLVVIFDEYAQIGLEFGADADKLISNLSNMARAAGIYIIIGSQYPRADVLTTLATINFQVRIAFNMTGPASNAMIGDHSASGLACRGRAIFKDYDKMNEVQTPRITDSAIKDIVKHAIDGEPIEDVSKVDIEEIMELALEQLDGYLDIEKVYPLFRGKLTQKKLKVMLKDAEYNENNKKVFDIMGTKYRVTQSSGRSRKMVLDDTDQIPDLNAV